MVSSSIAARSDTEKNHAAEVGVQGTPTADLAPGIAAYGGRYVVAGDPRSACSIGAWDCSCRDQRVLTSRSIAPRRLGALAEYTIDRGPEFNPVTDSLEIRRLSGGVVTATNRLARGAQVYMPFARYSLYDAGKKHERAGDQAAGAVQLLTRSRGTAEVYLVRCDSRCAEPTRATRQRSYHQFSAHVRTDCARMDFGYDTPSSREAAASISEVDAVEVRHASSILRVALCA